MKYLKYLKYSAGILSLVIVLILSACAEKDELPIITVTPILTDLDLPEELLNEIFTDDIPDEIKDVDEFLQKIEANGMKIYRGINPANQYLTRYQYFFKNQCIYDEKLSENSGRNFGGYIDLITFYYENNKLVSDLDYYSKEGVGFPEYPDYFDRGVAKKGYVSGISNGNNFTVFYRVNGTFDKVNYDAIWIVSFSIQISTVTILKDFTKCLIMVNKGPDPERKVASIGAVRIFRDDNPIPG